MEGIDMEWDINWWERVLLKNRGNCKSNNVECLSAK